MLPTGVAVALTAVFLVTGALGALALHRGVRSRRPGACGDTRSTELLHVLMSVAMVAMAWGWTGGLDTAGGVVQVAVFGGSALVLVGLAVLARRPAFRVARLSHASMGAAMVWMVAAMPVLMRAAASSPTGAMPAGAMAGMAGMGHAGHGAAPLPAGAPVGGDAWAPTVTMLLAAVLAVVGLAWGVRAVQLGSPAHRLRSAALADVPAPRAAVDAALPSRVPALPAGGASAPATGSGPTVADRPVPVLDRAAAPRSADGPRAATLAASCHALMGVGTAAMLVAML